MLPIELTNDEIKNTKAYKEYYACAAGEAAPKPKASARRKRNGSDTFITPPTATTTPTTTVVYGAMLPIELTNDEIKNTKAYKEYYACATGEAAPKPKASARRKRNGSDTFITPPTATTTPTTTVVVTPRLTTAKGKQPAKAKSPSDPSE
nr:hypothetical protein [Tanacetum cinerariifolium]